MDAKRPVGSLSLEEFQRQLMAGDSITGAVAVAAVTAWMAVSVLRMVLGVAARKNDSAEIQKLMAAAESISERLAKAPDEDRAAYASYIDARRQPKSSAERNVAITAALRRATEIPLAAARAGKDALGLCREAAGIIEGDIAADIRGAAALLAGAIRAILTSVDANLQRLEGQPFHPQLAAERKQLADRV